MKQVPDENILLFKSCLVSVEYPGIESSTKFVFDKLVLIMIFQISKPAVQVLDITLMFLISLQQQLLEHVTLK